MPGRRTGHTVPASAAISTHGGDPMAASARFPHRRRGRRLRAACVAGVAAAALTLAGCSEDGPAGPGERPVEAVEVTPSEADLLVGDARTFSAEARDAQGEMLEDASVAWSLERPEVATLEVLADGRARVTADRSGFTDLRATAGGAAGGADLHVPAPTDTVGPAGAQAVEAARGEVTIRVPEGALAAPTPLSVRPAPADSLPAEPDAAVVEGRAYQFGPAGTAFDPPARITIHYHPGFVPAGTDESDLRLLALTDEGWARVDGSEAAPGRNRVRGPVASFSVYAVGRPANFPPSATIEAPASGAAVAAGRAVTLRGSADDREDGRLSGDALVWRSDVDGEIGTGEEVTTDALSVGEHAIELVATDSDGATGRAEVALAVRANRAPAVTIASPVDGAAFVEGDLIPFRGSADDREDGRIGGDALVWRSDVDGEIGTGEEVVRPVSPGEHEIELVADDDDGATGRAAVTVTVRANEGPEAALGHSPSNPEVGETVTLDAASSSDPVGSIAEYRWDLEDDGTVDRTTTSASTTHAYSSAGDVTAAVTVVDDHGVTDRASTTVSVNAAPSAELTHSPSNPETNETVTFDASGSADADGSIVEYRWDFESDGTIDEITASATATHAYPFSGDIVVTVTVVDDDGAVGLASTFVSVNAPPEPT